MFIWNYSEKSFFFFYPWIDDILISFFRKWMDSNKQTMLVVIGSSNFEQAIDPAIKRPGRFDKIIHVPLPDVRGRQQVISLAKIKREKILATLVGLREWVLKWGVYFFTTFLNENLIRSSWIIICKKFSSTKRKSFQRGLPARHLDSPEQKSKIWLTSPFWMLSKIVR